ncbi:MAG: zinc ribbon domain-containing protein [Acidimicrobiales bacterium]|nr:zinc ribbon domain-containing protein [Acidimicrobiales bacterium]
MPDFDVKYASDHEWQDFKSSFDVSLLNSTLNESNVLDFATMAIPAEFVPDEDFLLGEKYFSKFSIGELLRCSYLKGNVKPTSAELQILGLIKVDERDANFNLRVHVTIHLTPSDDFPSSVKQFWDIGASEDKIIFYANCPGCGAPAERAAQLCKYCNTDLREKTGVALMVEKLQLY